ncbi:MAG TPA: S8 family serine peptidase [Actinomycetota bacterium]|nr:S8 family serine peptidase [Actinomycetota bacterium]
MFRVVAVTAILTVLAGLLAAPSFAAPPAREASGRYLVLARSTADLGALRAKAVADGAKVVRAIPQINAMVVTASAATKGRLAADSRARGVATDRLTSPDTIERAKPDLSAPGLRGARRVAAPAAAAAAKAAGINPDPAWDYKGLLWDYRRMGLPAGWEETAGSPAVTVGVADTGLDYSHAELASKVVQVIDFTVLEGEEPICKTLFGQSDQDLAAEFGGPADGDWNGHGSWIGGNIGAALNGTGTNGIAPKVKLVALKISQWCGFSSTAAELASFVTAADLGIDVVNISFGGYLDPADPESAVAFQAYADAIAYARGKGTLIVGSAGNAHVRIGANGRITSHGQLTTPGTAPEDFVDLFGYYRVPTGPPGALVVSATGNLVNATSASCPPGTADNANATCKPASDLHQPFGVGKRDQLAYYSNYGARIDIAAPGGARKFNLGAYDRGGTPGFPVTADDLTNAWQTFSTTSNWAVEIPCYTFTTGSGFPQGQCYSTIQGTSMAAPHAAAAVALIASEHPSLRHRPGALVARLQAKARTVHNSTPPLSATDTSPGDLTGVACGTGFCHLGGPPISNRNAYGAGLAYVANP